MYASISSHHFALIHSLATGLAVDKNVVNRE